MKKLRVWHIQNPPREPMYHKVHNIEEAKAAINLLANEDLRNKAVECNAFGLQVFEDGEWCEWNDEETGMDIIELRDSQEVEK